MSVKLKATVGAAVWLGYLAVESPHPAHGDWLRVMLLFAALVLVPLTLEIFADDDQATWAADRLRLMQRVHSPAALLLLAACLTPAGLIAAGLAIPWLVFTTGLAGTAVARAKREGVRRSLPGLCADAALVFALVGGAWTVAERAGFSPLGFDSTIVALTAVHFHFAGLLLPLFAGLVQRELWFSRFAARAAVGAVLGVPAVAVGITATQLGWGSTLETAAGAGLALVGMAVAILHVRIALEAARPAITRVWLGLAGVSLFFAMVLAGLYAIRSVALPFPWLGVPQMQMLHGTLNAFGFGLCGALGWRGMKKK